MFNFFKKKNVIKEEQRVIPDSIRALNEAYSLVIEQRNKKEQEFKNEYWFLLQTLEEFNNYAKGISIDGLEYNSPYISISSDFDEDTGFYTGYSIRYRIYLRGSSGYAKITLFKFDIKRNSSFIRDYNTVGECVADIIEIIAKNIGGIKYITN